MLQSGLSLCVKASNIRVIKKLQCLSPNVVFKMFDAQVASVLLYSSEVWGVYDCSIVELVHLEALKRFLNVPLRAPNKIVYGETGRYPLQINSTLRAVKYWLKLLRMENVRYPNVVYKILINSTDQRNWAH